MRSSNGTFSRWIEALRPVKRARVVHEDPPHHLRRNPVEMCAALPGHSLLSDEPHVRFVDESGRLKGVVGSLAAQVGSSAAPQLLVNKRHEVVPSLEIASAPRLQQAGHIIHDAVSSDLAR